MQAACRNDLAPSGEKIFLRYDQGVLGDYRAGEREALRIAESDLLMAVLYRQIHGFFDSVVAVPSRGWRAADFGDLAHFGDGLGVVARYADRLDVVFFGLSPDDAELIDGLERLAQRSHRDQAARTERLGRVRRDQLYDFVGVHATGQPQFRAGTGRGRQAAEDIREVALWFRGDPDLFPQQLTASAVFCAEKKAS